MSYPIKDNKKDILNKKHRDLSIFDRFSSLVLNDYHTYLVKKVERLTSALYVITGFLPHDEPVRNRLRLCALEIVASSSQPKHFYHETLEAFRARCAEIGTLLQAAKSAGLLSAMNADLLSGEYAALAAFVAEHVENIGKTGTESDDIVNRDSIGHKKDIQSLGMSYRTKRQKTPVLGGNAVNVREKINGRRDILIDLLSKSDRISIRDAIEVIGGVSEKTVQRELLALVKDGVAIKEGERRWSTYKRAPVLIQKTTANDEGPTS